MGLAVTPEGLTRPHQLIETLYTRIVIDCWYSLMDGSVVFVIVVRSVPRCSSITSFATGVRVHAVRTVSSVCPASLLEIRGAQLQTGPAAVPYSLIAPVRAEADRGIAVQEA